MNQTELRNKIKDIQNNSNLTITEKNLQIQKLMSNKNIISNCTHYPNKKCDKFYFICCNKTYNCIFCSSSKQADNICVISIYNHDLRYLK